MQPMLKERTRTQAYIGANVFDESQRANEDCSSPQLLCVIAQALRFTVRFGLDADVT